MFDIGHEDDMVIELANEVRNILGKVGKGDGFEGEEEADWTNNDDPPAVHVLHFWCSGAPMADATVAMDS